MHAMTTKPYIARHSRWSAAPFVGHRLVAVKPSAFDRPARPAARQKLRHTGPLRLGAERSFPPALDGKSRKVNRSLPLDPIKTARIHYVRAIVFLTILIIIAIFAS